MILISDMLAEPRTGIPDKAASAMDVGCLKYIKFDMRLLRRWSDMDLVK